MSIRADLITYRFPTIEQHKKPTWLSLTEIKPNLNDQQLKKLLGAPQIGQGQSSGISCQRVPGAIPLSGSPLASS
jgi:hypothetical protein